MAKQIKFEFEGNSYTLEYNRKAIVEMEKSGVNLQDAEANPFSTYEALIKYAFYKNHKLLVENNPDKIFEIWAELPHKEKLLEALMEMLSESVSFLASEPDEKNAVEWTLI